MNRDCKFLETIEDRGREMLCCSIGVNFYFVGDDREFCCICPVPDAQPLPDCQYLDPFTVLRSGPGGVCSVELDFVCMLKDPALRDSSKCALCPAYEENTWERHHIREEGACASR